MTFVPPVPTQEQLNKQAIVGWLGGALDVLGTMQTQARGLLPVAQGGSTNDYAASNLANLNDLLHKLQQVIGGPSRDGSGGMLEIIAGMRIMIRELTNQFDGST